MTNNQFATHKATISGRQPQSGRDTNPNGFYFASRYPGRGFLPVITEIMFAIREALPVALRFPNISMWYGNDFIRETQFCNPPVGGAVKIVSRTIPIAKRIGIGLIPRSLPWKKESKACSGVHTIDFAKKQ